MIHEKKINSAKKLLIIYMTVKHQPKQNSYKHLRTTTGIKLYYAYFRY